MRGLRAALAEDAALHSSSAYARLSGALALALLGDPAAGVGSATPPVAESVETTTAALALHPGGGGRGAREEPVPPLGSAAAAAEAQRSLEAGLRNATSHLERADLLGLLCLRHLATPDGGAAAVRFAREACEASRASGFARPLERVNLAVALLAAGEEGGGPGAEAEATALLEAVTAAPEQDPASASRAHRALALVHEAAGQPGLAAACLEKAEAVETAGWEARKAAAASIPGAG